LPLKKTIGDFLLRFYTSSLQSHAGCMFLIGDYYQTRLPSWLSNFKLLYNLKLLVVNSVAVTVIILNVISLLKPVPVVAEMES
jgi:hypothetical protein